MKYDLRKIMKMAHRDYNSPRFRCGRTFGECLKEAWEIVEKPRDFDPLGQTGFAHLWLQYD